MSETKTLPDFARIREQLYSFVNYERVSDYKTVPLRLGTERIQRLLELCGDPQGCCPAVHIAGTKGKGSTAYLTARLLSAQGLRVGLYLSPHVYDLRERIQLCGAPISEEEFCRAYREVEPALERLRDDPELKPPTFFETLTALAFAAFRAARLEAMVVEVGLGGRLDATNVDGLPVRASCICPISLDHTKQLGSDLLSIASEKAGILRGGVPVVLGRQERGVEEYLLRRAAELGCRVVRVGREATAKLTETPPPDVPEAPQRLELSTWRAEHRDVPLPLAGICQADNAAAALALAETFCENGGGGPVDTASIKTAWRDAYLPGRFEIVGRNPWVIFDAAHNPASMWALSETLRARFSRRKTVLVLAASRDKDVAAMLKIIAPAAEAVVLTSFSSPRCLEIEAMRALLPENFQGEVHSEPEAEKALALAKQLAGEEGIVCATGSFYLLGEYKKS